MHDFQKNSLSKTGSQNMWHYSPKSQNDMGLQKKCHQKSNNFSKPNKLKCLCITKWHGIQEKLSV